MIYIAHQIIEDLLRYGGFGGRSVWHYGEMRSGCKGLVGKHDVKGHLEDLEVDGRIILKCVLRKKGGFL